MPTEIDQLRAIANAARDIDRNSKSKANSEAFDALGVALVAYNGAPLAFRGPLNPTAPIYPHAVPAGWSIAETSTEDSAPDPIKHNVHTLGVALAVGVVLSRRVVAQWSQGDLAGAVNALEEWADETESRFPALDFSDDAEDPDDIDSDRYAIAVIARGKGGDLFAVSDKGATLVERYTTREAAKAAIAEYMVQDAADHRDHHG